MTRRSPWIAVLALAALISPAASGREPNHASGTDEKLVLVLSGGGARGTAHVGVLEVLEELQIAPDLIIGTSMGSIVGGLYAAGWSPAEMEELLASMDWNSLFSDQVPRSQKSFRRKQDDRPILIQARIHFNGWKPYIPPGILGGVELRFNILHWLSASISVEGAVNDPLAETEGMIGGTGTGGAGRARATAIVHW